MRSARRGRASALRLGAALALAALLSACSSTGLQWGSRSLEWPWPANGPSAPAQTGPRDSFGRGPVPVSLLLPLSGDAATRGTAEGLANAMRLAIAFVETNPNIGENITITLRDSGTTGSSAAAAAQAALASGSKLILGPVSADQVVAAGAVAQQGGVPLIGFAGDASAARPGVYLLSLLPSAEMQRSLSYLRGQGRRGPAGAFPATPWGEAQATAFRKEATTAGFALPSVYMFSSPGEAAGIVAQAQPLIARGQIDALFLPDPASAPAFGAALAASGLGPDAVQVVGSSAWSGGLIGVPPGLAGAVYPSLDPAGAQAVAGEYQARFGSPPPPGASMAYTAAILANVNALSLATPPYPANVLTSPSGFRGRDGLFRLLPDGRSEHALALMQLGPTGPVVLEAAGF